MATENLGRLISAQIPGKNGNDLCEVIWPVRFYVGGGLSLRFLSVWRSADLKLHVLPPWW